jgi:hypothetical protein
MAVGIPNHINSCEGETLERPFVQRECEPLSHENRRLVASREYADQLDPRLLRAMFSELGTIAGKYRSFCREMENSDGSGSGKSE